MAQKEPIIIDNFNMGGLADSMWSGIKYSLYRMLGWDVHSKPGVLRVAQKLSKVSGTTITELVGVMVNCSDGNKYMFSAESGKIWKCTSNDTISLVHTIVPEVGEAKILGAKEFNGYLIIATEKRLHRIAVSKTSNWASNIESNWAELNLDQAEIGGTGATYAVPTSISESAVNTLPVYPSGVYIEGFSIFVGAKGTGNWTVTLHDSANNVIASKTIANASIPSSGKCIFTFDSIATVQKLGDYHIHVTVSTGTSTLVCATADDLRTAQTRVYTLSDNEYHPMFEINLKFFVGDRNRVHQIDDDDTFTQNALDIPEPHRVKSLGKIGTDLLVGSIVNATIAKSRVYRWNTYSVSFTNDDEIEEVGINAFIPGDNVVYVQAGLAGSIYIYNGETLDLYKRIPGDYSPTAYATVYPNAVANLKGISLFGFSNGLGNPAYCGVYALGRNSRNYSTIMDLPYPISERITVDEVEEMILENIVIGSLLVSGTDLYVAWKRTIPGTPDTYVCGVDKLDYSNKLDGAFLETKVIRGNRIARYTFNEFVVPYVSLPEGTDIVIAYKPNYVENESFVDGYYITDSKDDSETKSKKALNDAVEANTLQLKVTARTNGNDAPEIEALAVYGE